MGYSLGTLTAYVKQNADMLAVASVMGGKTAKMMTPMLDVKSSATINIMDSDAVFQADTACAFNASGTTTITQRTITVGRVKVEEATCQKDFEAYYTQQKLKAGGTYTDMLYAADYTNLKVAKIQYQNELGIWQGDTTSATNNLSYYDGLIKLIDAAYVGTLTGSVTNVNAKKLSGTAAVTNGSGTVTGTSSLFTTELAVGSKVGIVGVLYTVTAIASATSMTVTAVYAGTTASGLSITGVNAANENFASPVTSVTGITTSNALGIAQSIFRAIPQQLIDKSDISIFCGWDFFRTLISQITTTNFFAYVTDSAIANGSLMVPGTTLKVEAVAGLTGTNRLFAIRTSGMFLGTDLMDEEEKFTLIFNPYQGNRGEFTGRFKLGVNVAFPTEVTQFLLA